MNNHESMLPSEDCKSTVRCPEKSNLAEAQNEDFKIAIMKMFKDLKEGTNTCLNKVHEDTVKRNSENNSRHESRIS